MGYTLPINPIANVFFEVYGYMSMSQTVAFLADFKLGHYIKIPPRSMFLVQLISMVVAGIVNLGVEWWLLNSIHNIFQDSRLPSDSPWTCPSDHVFLDASGGTNMGLIENCNGRKRPAEDQEFDNGEGYKRLCRPVGREYEHGLSAEYKKMGMMDNNIQSVIDSDDIFIYNYNGTGNSAFINDDEQLIIHGDLGRSIRSPGEDYTSLSFGYGANLLTDLHKDSDEVVKNSEVGLSCYDAENPLEGLDLFFDDVGLDFGVQEDNERLRESHVVADHKHADEGCESELICNENVWAAAACTLNTTEQAFIEENEVHDWLFSSDQADPSLGYCSGDLLEPSMTHLLKGMAGS
ncbi:hypothetical protein KI387_001274 [Taxus chinensis]|uniref:Uncharacterized protein n=1 Tax=Taxus chinensis TaxID=29808 RepID=A0AA38LMI1_TAXCH|nr:hypothetical protein KI387_001274 [Taxus chinensis]